MAMPMLSPRSLKARAARWVWSRPAHNKGTRRKQMTIDDLINALEKIKAERGTGDIEVRYMNIPLRDLRQTSYEQWIRFE